MAVVAVVTVVVVVEVRVVEGVSDGGGGDEIQPLASVTREGVATCSSCFGGGETGLSHASGTTLGVVGGGRDVTCSVVTQPSLSSCTACAGGSGSSQA
ncbi:hypothetical protein EXIGLDRAFT_279319 [Exidia glandulosa HHB12029]|uniref:Secreted protein n=1 Tax=Exidia glandulosa HHB12029 TaxID=1314781 RepID=A0A165ZPK5_EXIGL|nr:hypothetical protein EXIGLDRAFT_279319 [Exidia glandulosa HHB12029]